MLRIEFNARLADAKFRYLARNIKDLKPVEEPVVKAVLAANRRVFATKGASIGRPWKPLAKSTLKRRRYRKIGTQPLRYTSARGGRAWRSLTQKGHQMGIAKVERGAIVVGSKSIVAVTATKGGTIRPRHGKPASIKVPKRPVTGVDTKLRTDITQIYTRYLSRIAKRGRR